MDVLLKGKSAETHVHRRYNHTKEVGCFGLQVLQPVKSVIFAWRRSSLAFLLHVESYSKQCRVQVTKTQVAPGLALERPLPACSFSKDGR